MNDGDFPVDILDEHGRVTGNKLRKEIVKGQDIYHAVYCVLVTLGGSLAVSKIAAREDLPNLHAGSYGCTAATIKRTEESAQDAMKRALQNELKLDAEPELLEEKMINVDNTYRKIGIYRVHGEVPTDFSTQDIDEIVVFSPSEFNDLLEKCPDKVTPILKLFWEANQT